MIRKIFAGKVSRLLTLCLMVWSMTSCEGPFVEVEDPKELPSITIPDSCPNYFSLGLDIDHEAATTAITIVATANWELLLEEVPQWCSVSPQSGGCGTHHIVISTEENTSPHGRTAQLVIAAGRERHAIDIHNYSSSRLPAVFITYPNTLTIPPKTEPWLDGVQMTIIEANGTVSYQGRTGIRGRGNSTWTYPKKPYNLKLKSETSVLGMPPHKRWSLMANWMDRTLMRNHIAFEVARCTGMAWNPHGEFVELLINGEHQGNYYLCEQVKVGKHRVNIGDEGQLLELDVYYDEEFKFWSKLGGLPYMFKDPDIVTQERYENIREYVNHMEEVLYDDEALLRGDYRELMDVDSYVDWWLVHELTNNREPNHPKSTYMYKEAGGKLFAGPVWDFDWGGFRINNSFVDTSTLYYPRLLQDPWFVARVKERWAMFKPDFEQIPNFIRIEAERIRASEEVNHTMWPITQNINGDEGMTFDQAVERMIRAYTEKLNWMDEALKKL